MEFNALCVILSLVVTCSILMSEQVTIRRISTDLVCKLPVVANDLKFLQIFSSKLGRKFCTISNVMPTSFILPFALQV